MLSVKAYGFTIIEFCVAMFIVCIIATIVLPSYQYLLDRSQADIAKAELLRLITLAQKTAIAKHAEVIICKSRDLLHCNGTWQDGELMVVNSNANNIDGHDDIKEHQIIYAQQPHSVRGVIRWQSYPRYRDYILFMPTGFLGSDNSTFWYCLPKNTLPVFAVHLSKSGRARVVYPNHDGNIKDSKKRILSCNF